MIPHVADEGCVWPRAINVEAAAVGPKTRGGMALKMSIIAICLHVAKLVIADPVKMATQRQ